MAIMVTFDYPGVSVKQYDDAIRELERIGQAHPPGRLFHVTSAKGSGVLAVDVWESPESFQAFGNVLVPILLKLGASPGAPMVAPAHNVIVPM